MKSLRLVLLAPFVLAMWPVASAIAAGRVELNLVAEPQADITAQQQWAQRLGQAGVSDLRIRQKMPGDEIKIDIRGTEASPVYAVTGVLTSDGQIVVPGGSFRTDQIGQFVQWLNDLALQGPADQRAPRSAFGLTAAQFGLVRKEMAQPVGFSTAGLGRGEAVRRIAARLSSPLRVDRGQFQAMDAEKVAEELTGLSCGTALAYVIRYMGLALVPRESAGAIEYAVVPAAADMEAWPVGWKPELPVPKLLPAMYESRNVNIEGVPAAQVLGAISQGMNMPVLMDHNALARYGIEPDKVIVKLRAGKSTYSAALQRSLFQAGLKYEVRLDEAGTPFFWVTSLKPLSGKE